MDNFFDLNQMNYYNYNNFEYMNLDPFSYINEVSNGNKLYLRDKIMPEAKKKKKKVFNSVDENLNYDFFGNYNNNFNRDINKINNNFGQRKEKEFAFDFNNQRNMFMNLENYNPTEVLNPSKNHAKVSPFIYNKMYPQQEKTNNIKGLKKNNNNDMKLRNNFFKRNLNNQNLKHENTALKKNININNKMNNNIPYKNNKNIPNQMKNIGQNYQIQSNRKKNQIYIPPNINMNNNFILNNNINNNVKFAKKNILRNIDEIPNYQLRKNKEQNDIINKNNKVNNNKNKKNNIHRIRKDKMIKDKPIENEEDESLSNIAEELYNAFVKKNKKKKKKEKKNIINNKIINNDLEQVFNVSICLPPKKLNEEFGCQAEFSKSSRNSRRNSFSVDNVNKKENQKENYQPEKVDIGIGIQVSLMPLLQMDVTTNEAKNNTKNVEVEKNDKKLNNQINEENENKENKIFPSSQNLNHIEIKDKGEEKLSGEKDQNNSEIKFKNNLDDLANSVVSIKDESIENRKPQNMEDDFKLGENLIESESEKENEAKKNKKKKRRVKIELNNNIYFNFLKNEIINQCQIRKGFFGDLEYFIPKKEEDISNSRIVFMPKASIKPFNKDEIKLDKDYKFRENMDEKEIVPELYDDEGVEEVEEKDIEEIANSLRGSIDKSINSSINESLRKSVNHSYNQIMKNSLMNSINTEGQGILRKLKAAFDGSVNKEY